MSTHRTARVVGAVEATVTHHVHARREHVRGAPSAPTKERPQSKVAPAKPESDDLQRIVGIGPIFAARLRKAGITSYAQLASLTPRAVRERIGLDYWRENVASWIDQARVLAG